MIYWVTETGPSSVRLYYENRKDPGLQGRVDVPFACARFPVEPFVNAPRKWIEASYNVAAVHGDAARRTFRGARGAGSARGRCPDVLPRAPLTRSRQCAS